jgi:S-DNA-T family DNA segregation ATPase FtsK/SpoIIIE
VVETQYASAARLQRELHVPYSRARRILGDLEQRHVVGPATGSLPRQVLLPKDRLPELEELLSV